MRRREVAGRNRCLALNAGTRGRQRTIRHRKAESGTEVDIHKRDRKYKLRFLKLQNLLNAVSDDQTNQDTAEKN